MNENDNDEKVDGPGVAAQILNRMSTTVKDRIVANIKAAQPALAAKIEEKLFNFDEIAELQPQGVQILVKSVEHKDLVIALKTANPGVKSALYGNMSERKREMVEEDFHALPPTRLIEVEEAQRRIMIRLDELRKAGLVKTAGKKDVWV